VRTIIWLRNATPNGSGPVEFAYEPVIGPAVQPLPMEKSYALPRGWIKGVCFEWDEANPPGGRLTLVSQFRRDYEAVQVHEIKLQAGAWPELVSQLGLPRIRRSSRGRGSLFRRGLL